MTVKHLNLNADKAKPKTVGLAARSTRAGGLADCWEQEIVPGVDRNRCDQPGADLTCADLSNINFSGADLRSNVLACANMSGTTVTGAISGGIEGQPNPPPPGWKVVNGFLVPTTPTPTPTPSPTPSPTVPTPSGGGGGVVCATGGGAPNTCVLGNVGPGGGRVFYVNETNGLGSKYLEAAPTGWDGGGADPAAEWGCDGTSIAEVETIAAANLSVIGSGQANTTAIVTGCITAGIAARLANDYAGGPGDWFLPSEAELNQLCKYAHSYDSAGVALFPAAQAAPVCDASGTLDGGFADEDYWSSSQNNASLAWSQDFGDGLQSTDDKDGSLRVRPVRAF